MRSVMSAVLGLVCGLALHWVLPSSQTNASRAEAEVAVEAADPPRCEIEWPRLSAEIGVATRVALKQSGVLDRLAALESTLKAGGVDSQDGDHAEAQAARAEDAPVERSAEQVRARDEQLELLQVAIERGSWTEEDATTLRQLLPAMAHPDRIEAMAKLSVAINNGEVKLEALRPF